MNFPRFPLHEFVIDVTGIALFTQLMFIMNSYMTHLPDVLLILFNLVFITYAFAKGYRPALIVLRIIGRRKS